MNTIAILPNLDKDPNFDFIKKTVEKILNFKKTVFLPDYLQKTELSVLENVCFLSQKDILVKSDLVVTLGGDGTILNIAKDASFYSVPIMGINTGSLGFLTLAERDSFSVFDEIFSGNFTVRKCNLLEIEVIKEDDSSSVFFAFNDAVIKGADSKMVTLSINVDNSNLNDFSADGVIFSTAIGSTAYSMSAGGPIVHPDLNCVLMTPVCPHCFNSRSVVLPTESVLSLNLIPPYRCDAVLTVDGKRVHVLKSTDRVFIRKSEKFTRLITVPSNNFFGNVREKLNPR